MALAHGAEVIERHDLSRPGKGYALDFGLAHLSAAPPGILIMIDADCRIVRGTIATLVKVCAETHRPTQALYLMRSPPGAEINQRVADSPGGSRTGCDRRTSLPGFTVPTHGHRHGVSVGRDPLGQPCQWVNRRRHEAWP